MKHSKGFTLVELMTVVAVVGILTAIAIPSYNAQIRKSRRADAVQNLGIVQMALERYRADCPSYDSAVACTGFTFPTMPTSTYYTITVTGGSATAYTVNAAARAGTSQASDTGCTTLSINRAGTRTPSTATSTCWPR